MPATTKPSRHLIGNRVASAQSKTERAQEDIEEAEAELHRANTVITDKLAKTASDAELAKAVAHNEQVEDKLKEASEELQEVNDLLKSEERDRERLERKLAVYQEGDGADQPGARTGSGSASVIAHLRQLTRHRVAEEPAGPALKETAKRASARKPARK